MQRPGSRGRRLRPDRPARSGPDVLDAASLLGQAAEILVSREGDAHGMKHLVAVLARADDVPQELRDRWMAVSLATIRFRPSFEEWWLLDEARATAEAIEGLE